MGIFGGQNRVKSQSSTTTLIAEGCSINGHLKVTNQLQIDGYVEGRIEADNLLRISQSGRAVGEIVTEHLIINGSFEGVCHATYIEVLSSGNITGTIFSDNLSIEPGGKFMGITNPAEEVTNKQPVLEQQNEDDLDVREINTKNNKDTLETDLQH